MSPITQISLDGSWDFQFDPADNTDVTAITSWRTATVPLPWQAQFDDLRHASGTAWYRRSFAWQGGAGEQFAAETALILHFGAVDYHATVWLNGQLVGEHEGGYLPFEFDVAPFVQTGENLLVVRVVDASADRSRYPAFPFTEVPHGKQSWYGPIGGIWQSVWLEARPKLHIVRVRLTPDVATAILAIDATLSNRLPPNARLLATVADPGGLTAGTCELSEYGYGQVKLMGEPALWSPDAPNLYTVVTELRVDDATQHATRNTCGFRTVEARDGRIYLNGQPIYLRGVLDQAYYPKTIYSPPSLEFLEDQARKAKALGLNCLRAHIKIEDPRYYEVADRLGLLIWTEIPNWVLLSDATDGRAKATFRGMVERDWNHPAIIAWTLINENWGTDLPRNPDHRRWLAEFYHEAKAIDPTRLIVDNSACCDNFHVAGDMEDFHHYRAIPDHAVEWDAWVADFASRANDWVWAADYQHERRADLPLVVSEFGNWGLPDPDAILEDGQDPWWFETGHEWGEGIVYPHAMRERFPYFGLDGVFGTMADFAQAQQEHMARSLHYEISTMRLHPSVAGYIITEFTDVHWECNGLLTMQRQVKHGLDTIFTPINQDQVVVARPHRWSGHPGATVSVDLHAFAVDGAGSSGTILWQTAQASGELPAPGGTVQIPLAAPGMTAVQVSWLDADGALLASNQIELACIAPLQPTHVLCVLDNPTLAAALEDLGYTVVDETSAAAQTAIWVASRYTKSLERAVQTGARLLLLAGAEAESQEQVRLPAGAVIPRANTPWQGDWATAFSWLKKQGPFAALPGNPLLEMEYAAVMPDAVLVGLPAWAYRTHSWAGLALGWIHKPVSLLAAIPYGKGQLVITTFKLDAATLATSAVAQAIWAGCIELLGQAG